MAELRRSDGLVPLTILGGFLGAGKSTWLRHQLFAGAFKDFHVIVNEAAETPVDNLLLTGAASLHVLAGGCACCEGLRDLLDHLRTLCNRPLARPGIVLETSGLAEPGVIAEALARDPILGRRITVERVVVLVDALHGLDQLRSEPLARAQTEVAGTLVITKPVAAIDALPSLVATLRRINPGAGLSAAEFGMPCDLPDIPASPVALPELAEREAIRPHRLNVGVEGGWIALSTWLSALLAARGQDVVRVKGVVRTPAGRLLLQSVQRSVQAPEILPETDAPGAVAPEEGVIVLIGRRMDEVSIQRSWALFGA